MYIPIHIHVSHSHFFFTCMYVLQGIPAFRDFTIRDPRYFVILFQAKFYDFEEKNKKKQILKCFLDFFF